MLAVEIFITHFYKYKLERLYFENPLLNSIVNNNLSVKMFLLLVVFSYAMTTKNQLDIKRAISKVTNRYLRLSVPLLSVFILSNYFLANNISIIEIIKNSFFTAFTKEMPDNPALWTL